MPETMNIRNVPEDVHATVVSRAATAGLSVSDQLLRLVIEIAEQPDPQEIPRSPYGDRPPR